MDLQLKGKNAVILGGTRGIGRAIADTLAAEGANVAICARNPDQVKDTVAALRDKGVKATGTPDADAMSSLIGKIGVAETILRPTGAVRIEGRRVTAAAESGIIDKGAAVKVVSTDGTSVVVRPEVSKPGA